MTNKEIMLTAIYKAMADGVSRLIKYGAAFTVLVFCIAGLIYNTFYIVEGHNKDRLEWKAEKLETRRECSEEINRLRVEVYECNERHLQVLREMAKLRIEIKKKR